MAIFDKIMVEHIPREHNTRDNVLSKLACMRVNGGNKFIIQEFIHHTCIGEYVMTTKFKDTPQEHNWMTPIIEYILNILLIPNKIEVAKVKCWSCFYLLIAGMLYVMGFSSPLLKCLASKDADYVLKEIHEGICGHYLGGRNLAKKVLCFIYYSWTIQEDA